MRLDHSILKRCLRYDPRTGVWIRKRFLHRNPETNRWTQLRTGNGGSRVGEQADRRGKNKYRIVYIGGQKYLSHRLAWFYMTGAWPIGLVDHKDCDPKNNSWFNLRLATHLQNSVNRKRGRNNKSGYKGVSKFRDLWQAKISTAGTVEHLGYFSTARKASLAYKKRAQELFGEFARHA